MKNHLKTDGRTLHGTRRSPWLGVLNAGAGLSICLFSGALSSCVHSAEALEAGGATVVGCLSLQIEEELDYSLPRQKRLANLIVVIARDEEDARRATQVRVSTRRDGCFELRNVPPGPYRLLQIVAPGERSEAGVRSPDITFPVWEQSLVVGYDGLKAVPVAQGTLPGSRFILENEATYDLGRLELTLRKDAYPPEEDCLTRAFLLTGATGQLYLSSIPQAARLCSRGHTPSESSE